MAEGGLGGGGDSRGGRGGGGDSRGGRGGGSRGGSGRTLAFAATRGGEGAPGGGFGRPDLHPTGFCRKPESEPAGQKDSGCDIAGQAGPETERHLGAVGGQGEGGRSGGGLGRGAWRASVAAGSASLSHNRLQELLEGGGGIVREVRRSGWDDEVGEPVGVPSSDYSLNETTTIVLLSVRVTVNLIRPKVRLSLYF